jgi:teichuronic acid biosynthesis glycosyltransferase TuaC
MKILVLTKRQYMGKDLLDDRFGRFREIPLELARFGHQVLGICLSYRAKEEDQVEDRDASSEATVTWHSFNVGKLVFPGLRRYVRCARTLAVDFRPDVIWACSDTFHAIFGARLGRLLRARSVLDLYDNFESYGGTHLPGVLPLFKRAVRIADGISCVSDELASRIANEYRRPGRSIVLKNAVRGDLFYPRDRIHSRKLLELPDRIKLVGTVGALRQNRGVETLFNAFELLASEDSAIELAIAGPRTNNVMIPKGPRIHDFGVLPLESVANLINAMDVAVVCNRESPFGRYNFPQKFYEIIACRVPVIAASVGSMKKALRDHPECLFEPENPTSLAAAVRAQLQNPSTINRSVPTWRDAAKHLESFFEAIIANHSPNNDINSILGTVS